MNATQLAARIAKLERANADLRSRIAATKAETARLNAERDRLVAARSAARLADVGNFTSDPIEVREFAHHGPAVLQRARMLWGQWLAAENWYAQRPRDSAVLARVVAPLPLRAFLAVNLTPSAIRAAQAEDSVEIDDDEVERYSALGPAALSAARDAAREYRLYRERVPETRLTLTTFVRARLAARGMATL